MHNNLGPPYKEEEKLSGFSLIAILLPGEPKMSWMWQPYNFGALDPFRFVKIIYIHLAT